MLPYVTSECYGMFPLPLFARPLRWWRWPMKKPNWPPNPRLWCDCSGPIGEGGGGWGGADVVPFTAAYCWNKR